MQKAICKPHGKKYNDGRNLGSLSTYGCILAPYLLPIFETGYLTLSSPPLGKMGSPIPRLQLGKGTYMFHTELLWPMPQGSGNQLLKSTVATV